jgi:hypothetical protein
MEFTPRQKGIVMPIKIKKQAASTVPAPASSHVQLFIDQDGLPKVKDSTDTVTELSQSNYVTLNDQGSAPLAGLNTSKLYAKSVLGVSEMFVLDDLGHEIQVTSNGSIAATVADAGTYTTATSFSAVVDHSYYASNNGVVVSLPDGSLLANRGKRLTITFVGRDNQVVLGTVPNNYLINLSGAPATEIISLPAGTYEFRAAYVTLLPGALWLVSRSDGTVSRRSTDVTFCLEGNFPANIIKTLIGSTGRWTLTATGSTPSVPTIDGGGAYVPGDTLLAPFDSTYPGLYRVNVMNSAIDWQVELIEAPLDRAHLSSDSETEYRIKNGEVYGSRSFLSNGFGISTLTSNYVLQSAPCDPYPIGHFLDGTPSSFGGHLSDQLLIGRWNQAIGAGSPLSFTLLGPDPISSGSADVTSTTSTLVDLAANFPNSLSGKTIVFTSGVHLDQRVIITSVNDPNTLQFSPTLGSAPGAGDTYTIVDLTLLVGARFGIKINPSTASLFNQGISLSIPVGYRIEEPVSCLTDTGVILILNTGGFCEWQLDWSGVWNVVNYKLGNSGA